MKISIIIVSYNVCSYLRQCLQSIYQSNEFGAFEIIVVDNYSYDESCQMVLNEFSQITLIKNKENLGFAKAVNIGIDKAAGEFICILNPDTLISDNTFKTLLEHISQNPKTGWFWGRCSGERRMEVRMVDGRVESQARYRPF